MSNDLFQVLIDEPPAPSNLRVEDIVTAGRARARQRRRRMATVATAGVGVFAVTGATVLALHGLPGADRRSSAAQAGSGSPSTSAQSLVTADCTPQELRSPRGDAQVDVGYLNAMDPTGRYVYGSLVQRDGRQSVVLWTNGVPRILATGKGYEANAVNASGMVVGRGGKHALKFNPNGYVTRLPDPAGATDVYASGINTRGDIVGTASFGDNLTKAVLWSAGQPDRAQILAAKNKWVTAFDIADDGTVVGTLGDGDVPYIWRPGGRGETLPVPAGEKGGKVFGVRGEWAYGWAGAKLGETDASGAKSGNVGEPQWVRWNLRTKKIDLLSVGLWPYAVSASGAVFGVMGLGTEFVEAAGAQVIWRDGTLRKLPPPARLSDGTKGTPVIDPDAPAGGGISDDGKTIVGMPEVEATGGTYLPVIWHC